jgi:hypothetical protein
MAEVINPPSQYFTNIDFNPEFYTFADGSLSLTEANSLYLQKTRTDTATALETFTAGIQTSNLSSTGTGASNILNIGVEPRTVAGAIHHYSDGDNCVSGAGVHINNGLNNNSATNIHNGTGANATGAVNIMSGSANSGTIIIGNETTNNTTTTLRGNTTLTKLATALTPTYNYPVSSGNVGQIITGTNTIAYPTANVIKQISSMSLDKGVWYLVSFMTVNNTPAGSNHVLNHVISLTTASLTSPIGALDMSIFPTYTASNTVSANLSINATTTIYVNIKCDVTSVVAALSFTAVRLA